MTVTFSYDAEKCYVDDVKINNNNSYEPKVTIKFTGDGLSKQQKKIKIKPHNLCTTQECYNSETGK